MGPPAAAPDGDGFQKIRRRKSNRRKSGEDGEDAEKASPTFADRERRKAMMSGSGSKSARTLTSLSNDQHRSSDDLVNSARARVNSPGHERPPLPPQRRMPRAMRGPSALSTTSIPALNSISEIVDGDAKEDAVTSTPGLVSRRDSNGDAQELDAASSLPPETNGEPGLRGLANGATTAKADEQPRLPAAETKSPFRSPLARSPATAIALTPIASTPPRAGPAASAQPPMSPPSRTTSTMRAQAGDGKPGQEDAAARSGYDVSLGGYMSREWSAQFREEGPDVTWGMTERERVYSTLFFVPWQVERFVDFGYLLCLDSVLAVLTLLPLRAAVKFGRVGLGIGKMQPAGGYAAVGTRRRENSIDSRRSDEPATESSDAAHPPEVLIRGEDINDVAWLVLVACGALMLCKLDTGAIYHWIRSQEVIKLYVVYNSLEILDRMLCSFGSDTLEALASSCGLLSREAAGGRATHAAVFSLASDLMVSIFVQLMHAVVLMCQAITFSVAVNSTNNNLLGLLVSNNFVEIKGNIFKRMDFTRVHILSLQDVVERFHISSALCFVLVESMIHMSSPIPAYHTVRQCAIVLVAEVLVDVTKHAFLGKYNALRPGIYSEFQRDLSVKALQYHSGNVHRALGFHPPAAAALVVRIAYAVYVHLTESVLEPGPAAWLQLAGWAGGGYLAMLGGKVVLGFVVRRLAHSYVQYHKERNPTVKRL